MTESIKNLNLMDSLNIKDKISLQRTGKHYCPRTEVKLYTDEDGEMKLKWTKHNMMTLAGGGFLARTLFDFSGGSSEITPNYNNALRLEKSQDTESGQTSPIKVFGFCVGTDGCGLINSQVRAPKYASWITPDWTSDFGKVWGGIVPFQYRRSDDDLTQEERQLYFGRQVLSDYYAYYFKGFDSEPVMTQKFVNGASISSDVYSESLASGLDVETCVTMQMSITKLDCRNFFYGGFATGAGGDALTLNDARINSISLLMGWPWVDEDSYTYYQQVRPLTLLYFSNESLIDLRKSITIQYSLYF